uniref:Uncharacterized protein n=1 Tax=Cajanus cajan TaxID=3821 RepID=A0A151SAU2_CAJCA|nr:hypothetical protein KK1_026150 [Cajanus cajan]
MGEFQSVFRSFLEINAMRKSHRICDFSVSKFIRLEPCWPDERVYMGGPSDPPFFYLYQCIFRDLGVCLPFSQFECDFLNFINSAPYQLHPNSWGFFAGFSSPVFGLGDRGVSAHFSPFLPVKNGCSSLWLDVPEWE